MKASTVGWVLVGMSKNRKEDQRSSDKRNRKIVIVIVNIFQVTYEL